MSWDVMSWIGKSDVYQQPLAGLSLLALCCSIGAAPRVAVPCSLLLHTPITRRADHASRRRSAGRSPSPRSSRARLLRRFRARPGRLLFGERMAPPPGRRCAARAGVFCAFHISMKLFRDDAAGCWATTLRGHHCCRSGVWRHTRKTCVFLFLWVAVFFFWFFQVGRRAAAAPGLRRQGSAIEGHVVGSSQDTRRNLIFQQPFWFLHEMILQHRWLFAPHNLCLRFLFGVARCVSGLPA